MLTGEGSAQDQASELDGLDHAGVGGLDPGTLEENRLDTVGAQRLGDLVRRACRGDSRVGDHEHPPRAQLAQVERELVPRPDSELESGGTIGEDRLGTLGPEA